MTTDDTTPAAGNGYRLSVISDGYGGDRGLFEIAIIHGGEICYGPAAAAIIGSNDGVRGWMTADDVAAAAAAVNRLPRLDGCSHRRTVTT